MASFNVTEMLELHEALVVALDRHVALGLVRAEPSEEAAAVEKRPERLSEKVEGSTALEEPSCYACLEELARGQGPNGYAHTCGGKVM